MPSAEYGIKTVIPKMNEIYDLNAAEVKIRTIQKEFALGNVRLNFENIAGKKIALFAGGIMDRGEGYSLISVSEIEELLQDLKSKVLKPDKIIMSALPEVPSKKVEGTPICHRLRYEMSER